MHLKTPASDSTPTVRSPAGGLPPEGTLGYCTGAQEAVGTKAQKEIWLVSGL